MKNHELLDMIGEASEDYVLEAGNNVVKPRFRWKTIAACAACGLLALGAYPVYRAFNPPLHDYTVVEGGGTLATQDEVKAPAGGEIDVPGQGAPVPNPDEDGILNPDNPNRGEGPMPGGAYIGGDSGSDRDGEHYQIGVMPIDEAATDQYDKLLKGLGGVDGREPAAYPDWFAGAWIDTSCYYDSPAVLTVAIVDGFRTDELEAEITDWCGHGVVFQDAKYSHAFLNGLMEPVVRALDGTGLSCGIGVDVAANCLGVDLYSNGTAIPDRVLAELAKLDPGGDAIRVRLFTGKIDTLTDELVKGPAPEPVEPETRATPTVTQDGEPVPTPVDGSDPVYHGEDVPTGPAPGGARSVEELPETGEKPQPAHYDLLPLED